MVDRAAWSAWWRSRGEDRLALLLWALWNPIGPVPPDEYAGYAGSAVSILEKAEEAGAPVESAADDDQMQLDRNRLWKASVEELASHLARVRETMMGVPLDPAVERHTAEVLLDWYSHEMYDLRRS